MNAMHFVESLVSLLKDPAGCRVRREAWPVAREMQEVGFDELGFLRGFTRHGRAVDLCIEYQDLTATDWGARATWTEPT